VTIGPMGPWGNVTMGNGSGPGGLDAMQTATTSVYPA
jgi:hypothetical protein